VQSLAWGVILMGFKKPPMDNALLRQAIAHAVDIKEITNVALYGHGQVATSSISNLMTEWFTEVHKQINEYNPELAKQLIKQSGYNGEKIVITASKAYQHHERTAVLLQQRLKEVGLNVEIEFLDWPTWLSTRWATGDYNIIISHITPRPEPSAVYYSYLHIKYNQNGYNNPKMDELLDNGLNTVDPAERKKIYEDVHKEIIRDVPWISTYAVPTLEASQGIDGYKGWPYAYPRFWNVWLTK
jgi:peptide/nickel transport system substrate-binding protein